ncbi:MAG: matrixin family metalloprotease [Gemmatales bacterium]
MLNVSGNAHITLPGSVYIDSNSSSALIASGNATISASRIDVVGGVSRSGNAQINPSAQTGAAGQADPFATLPAPAGGTSLAAVNVTGNSSLTLNPGIYSSITVSGNGKLTLNPGTYILAGGGFNVSGNGIVNGTGVFFFNTGTDTVNNTGTFGAISFSGNAQVNLSAPTSGTYAGILFYQHKNNTRALSMSGNGMLGTNGTIYAPTAQVVLSGNAQIQESMVVNTLTISGNGISTLVTEGTNSTNAAAGQLLGNNLFVYVDNSNNLFSADELARIHDTILGINEVLAPYSVSITLLDAARRDEANVVLKTDFTSAAGTAAQGVLGSINETGVVEEITLLQGWNWYTGASSNNVAGGQYDFQTVVTHELGHALGLGHSADAASAMHGTLATGVAHRQMTTQDLSIADVDDVPVHALHAAGSQFAQGVLRLVDHQAASATDLISLTTLLSHATQPRLLGRTAQSENGLDEGLGMLQPMERTSFTTTGKKGSDNPVSDRSQALIRALERAEHSDSLIADQLMGKLVKLDIYKRLDHHSSIS